MFSKLAKMMLLIASTCMFSNGLYALGGDVFISRITDTNGNFSSRSLLEFHEDGTMTVSDSSQQGKGGPGGFPPFGIQHGYWVAESSSDSDPQVVKIKTVDFQYPKYFTKDWPTGFTTNKQSIVVLTATLTKEGKKYSGDVFLTFFKLHSDINDPSQGSGPINVGSITIVKIDKP